MYREMTEHELMWYLLERDDYRAWRTNTDYALAVYGATAATIELTMQEEYDEDGPYNTVTDVLVCDRAGEHLYPDTGGAFFDDERATILSMTDPLEQVDYVADLLEQNWSEALEYDRHGETRTSLLYTVGEEPTRTFTNVYVRVDEFTGKEQ